MILGGGKVLRAAKGDLENIWTFLWLQLLGFKLFERDLELVLNRIVAVN